MQGAINENASKGKDEMNELREMILQERDERTDEAKNMNDFFTKENDERKKNLDDVNEWIGVENAKRFDSLFKTFKNRRKNFVQTKRGRGAEGEDGEREARTTGIYR